MAAGEYIATKTQNEVMDGELQLEKKHFAENRDDELEELKEVFGTIGNPADDDRREVNELRERLLRFYGENDDAHLQCHAVLELGVVEDERRSEYIAGGVAFFLFLFGAMPSVIPFLATNNTRSAFIASAVLTTFGLLFVGGVKTWATRGNWAT
jgi:vacuolar iron transporter family protein